MNTPRNLSPSRLRWKKCCSFFCSQILLMGFILHASDARGQSQLWNIETTDETTVLSSPKVWNIIEAHRISSKLYFTCDLHWRRKFHLEVKPWSLVKNNESMKNDKPVDVAIGVFSPENVVAVSWTKGELTEDEGTEIGRLNWSDSVSEQGWRFSEKLLTLPDRGIYSLRIVIGEKTVITFPLSNAKDSFKSALGECEIIPLI